MLQLLRIVVMVAAAMALAGTPALAAKLTVTGDVTYRERIALPAGATLSVHLVDLAKPDESRITAAAALANPGEVPLTFTLNFDENIIVTGHSYGLVAEIIADNGAIWFRNATPYSIVLPTPVDPIVIVVSFLGSNGTAPAAPETPDVTPLLDITWEAQTLAGQPVVAGAKSSLSIAADMRAGGRGGCNSWFAQAEVNGEMLVFSAVAATRIACAAPEITAQEQAFFAAIASTRYWRIREDNLVLVDSAGTDLATFIRSRF
jgi:putative lipoprotein